MRRTRREHVKCTFRSCSCYFCCLHPRAFTPHFENSLKAILSELCSSLEALLMSFLGSRVSFRSLALIVIETSFLTVTTQCLTKQSKFKPCRCIKKYKSKRRVNDPTNYEKTLEMSARPGLKSSLSNILFISSFKSKQFTFGTCVSKRGQLISCPSCNIWCACHYRCEIGRYRLEVHWEKIPLKTIFGTNKPFAYP